MHVSHILHLINQLRFQVPRDVIWHLRHSKEARVGRAEGERLQDCASGISWPSSYLATVFMSIIERHIMLDTGHCINVSLRAKWNYSMLLVKWKSALKPAICNESVTKWRKTDFECFCLVPSSPFGLRNFGLSRTFPSLAHVAAQTPTKQKLREPEIPLLPQKEKKRCRNKGKEKKSEREKS